MLNEWMKTKTLNLKISKDSMEFGDESQKLNTESNQNNGDPVKTIGITMVCVIGLCPVSDVLKGKGTM